jgi:hypothetical protein
MLSGNQLGGEFSRFMLEPPLARLKFVHQHPSYLQDRHVDLQLPTLSARGTFRPMPTQPYSRPVASVSKPFHILDGLA